MKKTRKYIIFALAGMILAAAGCSNPFSPPKEPATPRGTAGSALIQFGGGGRTLLPYAADFYYVLDFTPGTGNDGTALTEQVSKSGSASVALAAGQWSLAVRGYIDAAHAEDTPEEPGLTGSADFTVTSGQQVDVPVTLAAFQSYEGEGEFGYTISFPADVISAELSLINILGVGDKGPIDLIAGASEADGIKTKTGVVPGVAAGFYRLVLDLSTTVASTPARALRTRVVRIQDSLLTKTEETFAPGDFYVGVLFDTVGELKTYLDGLPVNDEDTPYPVGLSAAVDLTDIALKAGGDNLGALYAALTRYVELDLSACTGASTGATGGGGGSRTNANKLVRVILPPQITTISHYSFSGCSNLRSVNLPEGLTTIGQGAFSGCSSLAGVSFPSGLTTLNSSVFSHSGIRSVDLSQTSLLTSIGDRLFQDCALLEEVKLPAGITSIPYYAFDGCELLDTLNWAELNSLATIGDYAFRGTGFTSLPIACSSLGILAFSDMAELVTADLSGYTGTTLPYALFLNCPNLEEVIFSGTITTVTANANGPTFGNCPQVRFTLGANTNFTTDGVTLLQGTTLAAANGAAGDYTVPGTVTAISQGAFMGAAMTRMDMSACSIAEVNNGIFQDCALLAEVVFSPVTTSIYNAFGGCTALTAITLPSALTYINYDAFTGASLQTVTIPTDITADIMGTTFPSRPEFVIQGSVTTGYDVLESGKILVKNHVVLFAVSTLSGTVVLDGSITGINRQAFQNVTGLISLELSSTTWTAIDYPYTFDDCTALQSVILPASLQKIGENAFYYATALEWVKWPVSAANAFVSMNAFNGCSSLTHVELPDNMTTSTTNYSAGINAAAFQGTALEVLILRADAVGLAENALTPGNYTMAFPSTNFTIYVPNAQVSAYKAASGWSNAALVNKIVSINTLPLADEPGNWN
jgi:hypothetical protein